MSFTLKTLCGNDFGALDMSSHAQRIYDEDQRDLQLYKVATLSYLAVTVVSCIFISLLPGSKAVALPIVAGLEGTLVFVGLLATLAAGRKCHRNDTQILTEEEVAHYRQLGDV